MSFHHGIPKTSNSGNINEIDDEKDIPPYLMTNIASGCCWSFGGPKIKHYDQTNVFDLIPIPINWLLHPDSMLSDKPLDRKYFNEIRKTGTYEQICSLWMEMNLNKLLEGNKLY